MYFYDWDGGEGGGRGGGGWEEKNNKIGITENKFYYYHAWYRFVIVIVGFAKGVPFVDLFSCFF